MVIMLYKMFMMSKNEDELWKEIFEKLQAKF